MNNVETPAVSTPATVEKPAASTPATETKSEPLTYQQYEQARHKGEMPGVTFTPKTEESAPSQDSSGAGKKPAEAAPDSEAGQSTQEPKSEKKPQNAETRKAQLAAEIDELLEKRRKLYEDVRTLESGKKPDEKPADSSTAKPATEELKPPVKPKLDDFEKYEDYEKANDEYVDKLAAYHSQKSINEYKAQQEKAQFEKTWNEKVTDARKRYADADQVIGTTLHAIFKDEAISADIKAWLNHSPILLDVLHALGSDKTKLHEFIQAARTNPREAVRLAVLIEAEVQGKLEKKTPASGTPERDGKTGQFVSEKAPEKKIPTPPNPPTEVGGTGTAPEDPEQVAVKQGDYTAFERARLAKLKK